MVLISINVYDFISLFTPYTRDSVSLASLCLDFPMKHCLECLIYYVNIFIFLGI